MLRDKINDQVKQAMKSQDKLRLSTLRLMNAAIQNAEIDARTGAGPLTDDDVLGLLQKMIKQREDSVVLYEQGGRKELADQERGEIEIIRGFLPQQMSEDEAKAAIGEVIKEIGAQGIKDMGKVMAALKQAYAGRMDFGRASGLVKGCWRAAEHVRPEVWGKLDMARSDFSKAPPLLQSCPQCGAEMRVARREPAPGNPSMERLFLECPKCGNTAGKMQARKKA